jgi:hypothetical protein
MKYDTVQVLNKIISFYFSIYEDKPLLEENIAILICDELSKNKLKINQLQFIKIDDPDHSDQSQVCNIIIKIIQLGQGETFNK